MNPATYAFFAAIFAALTTILTKVGVQNVPSNLATAIRTGVVLVMAAGIVLARGETAAIAAISRRSLWFLVGAGLATGASWLCYFAALRDGKTALVVAIDKLSLPITVLIAAAFLHEPIGKAGLVGIGLILIGTWLLTK